MWNKSWCYTCEESRATDMGPRLANVAVASLQATTGHSSRSTSIASPVPSFERVYFGFTALVETFDEEQKDAMRAIPLDRLLLETDSPHLPPRGHRRNNPALLGEVATTVADVLG